MASKKNVLNNEIIYVYECKKSYKLNPVSEFEIGEQIAFLKFIITKKQYKME